MGIYFKSVCKYVPENIVSNETLAKLVDTSDEWIFSRTGIKNRRISLGENVAELCVNAAKLALDKAGMSAGEVDCIIVSTVTGDFNSPSTACLVQSGIGAVNAFAFDINAACSGFVYALAAASRMLSGGNYKNALVIGAEVLSKYVDWSDRATCVLFGDGAGAALVSKDGRDTLFDFELHSDGTRSDAILLSHLPVKNAFCAASEPLNNTLAMNGREVFNFAVREVPNVINSILKKNGLTISDIDLIVPHQANQRIIEACAKKLGVGTTVFHSNLREYGNTSSASIPIALAELFEGGLLKSGQKIILVGFGGGLTWGAVLIEL